MWRAEEWYERDEMERSQRGIVAKSKFDHLLGERDVWATLFESMSHLYRQLGDGEKTPEYARRSVAIDQKRPTARSRIATLLRVGRVAAARRDFDSALRICHKGLDLAMAYFASLVVPRDVVAVCHHIGSILSHLQLFRQALRYHQRALELNRQFAHLGRMHNDHLAIGQIFEIRPDLGQALEHYESALRCLSIATKEADLFTWQASDGTVLRVVDPTLAGSATLAVARMYVQHQAHAQSEKLLALAVELTEVVRSNVAQNEYRIGFQANNMEAYESMIKFQVRFAKQEQTNHNSTNGRVTQAWQYAERARSRAFLELLGTSPIRPPIEIPEHLCHQETQLIEHLEALSQSSDGHQQEQQRAIWDEYEETRTKLEKVWQQMITITPMASDYVELRRGKPLEIKKLKALLSR